MSGEHTIGRWLADRARMTPQRVAIDHEGRTITYAELDALSGQFAAALAERGVERGDRVATLTRNSIEHVAVLFACAKAGFVLAPLSWRLGPAEIAYQLDDADPAALLRDA